MLNATKIKDSVASNLHISHKTVFTIHSYPCSESDSVDSCLAPCDCSMMMITGNDVMHNSSAIILARIEYFLLQDSTAEHFQPVTIVEDFQLP